MIDKVPGWEIHSKKRHQTFLCRFQLYDNRYIYVACNITKHTQGINVAFFCNGDFCNVDFKCSHPICDRFAFALQKLAIPRKITFHSLLEKESIQFCQSLNVCDRPSCCLVEFTPIKKSKYVTTCCNQKKNAFTILCAKCNLILSLCSIVPYQYVRIDKYMCASELTWRILICY